MPKSKLVLAVAAIAAAIASVSALAMTAADPIQPDHLFGLWRLRHVGLAVVLALAATGLAFRAAGREAFLGYSVALVSTVLFLGALEMAGRTGLIDWMAILSPEVRTEDTSVGWSLQPDIDVSGTTGQDIAARIGLDSDPIPFRFHTDRYGFRNGDEPEGEIVVLGDSIVLGAAVEQDQTVAEIIEDLTGTPTMQAALLGLAMQREQQMLLDSGLPLEGKTIVQFMFEGNDLLDSRALRASDNGPATDEASSLLRLVWARLVRYSSTPQLFETCDIGGQTYAFLWTRRSFAGVEDEFDAIADETSRFARDLEERGIRYRLVFVPTKYRVLHALCDFPPYSQIAEPFENLSDIPDRIRDWAASSGIAVLDLTPALVDAAAMGDIPWFWGDTHWNAAGHAVAGKAIAEWPALSGSDR